jgi:tetratricopeptide (TPR) repeat protein
MTAPLESSIVRFRKSNGAVVGAGFLVSDKHVLTCAHVVADALGIARDTQDRPTEDVYLDFPLVDSETQLTARVVFWRPVPPKGSTSIKGKEDIAGFPLFFGGLFLAVPKSSTLLEVNKCENMSKKPNSFRIAIANFYNTSKDSDTILLTEKRLLDRLEADKPDKVEICLANETVSTSKEAQAVGEKLGATIVIWGRWDTSSYDVFLKGIETELVYLSALSVQSANASEYKLQTKDLPGLLNVMVAYAISQAYYSNGQIPMAREVLANALEVADARKLYTNNSNAERLGEAYFLLGVMFDADIDSGCENTLEDCRNAIRFYREASKLNRKLYLALLNQGLLHKQLKEFDQAVAAFSQIINSDSESPSAVGARIHRAEILLAQDKSETALKDLEIVCQQDPEELLYRHFLGLAQLQAGQPLEAEQTYQHIKRYIGEDNELKSQIMEDLNLLAKKEENVTLITTIIILFQSL